MSRPVVGHSSETGSFAGPAAPDAGCHGAPTTEHTPGTQKAPDLTAGGFLNGSARS